MFRKAMREPPKLTIGNNVIETVENFKLLGQGHSEPLMNGGGGGAVEKFPNSLEYFRTKLFTIFSIVSDVTTMKRVSRRLN